MSRIVELRRRLGEISDRIDTILSTAETEARALTTEERASLTAAEAEEREVNETIAAEERAAQRRERLAATPASQGPAASTAPEQTGEVRARVGENREASAPFRNITEWIAALRFNPSDPRLTERRELNVGTPASGGIMVPEEFRGDLLEVSPDDAIFRPRATVIPAGSSPDASIRVPALDQTAAGSNMYGGVEVAWINEGDEKPETTATLRDIELSPHEVAGVIVVTDKLLRNWQAADAMIGRLLRGALISAEDAAFHSGDGVGKPLGVTASDAAVDVTRAGVGAVAAEDILAMYARLLRKPGARPAWVISPTALPSLMTLNAANGNQLWQPNLRDSTPGTLLGIPLLENAAAPAVGTRGDVILVDMQYYLIKDGFGPSVQASEHVLFRSNKTVIKAFNNVDGKPWLVAPFTIGGEQYSPFVVLA